MCGMRGFPGPGGLVVIAVTAPIWVPLLGGIYLVHETKNVVRSRRCQAMRTNGQRCNVPNILNTLRDGHLVCDYHNRARRPMSYFNDHTNLISVVTPGSPEIMVKPAVRATF